MKPKTLTLLLAAALVLLSVVSLFLGVMDISPEGVLRRDFEQVEILLISRLPRLLAILCTGVGMSISGLIMQQLCMNKFVSPTTGATISVFCWRFCLCRHPCCGDGLSSLLSRQSRGRGSSSASFRESSLRTWSWFR